MVETVVNELEAPLEGDQLSVDPMAPIKLQQFNDNGIPDQVIAEESMLASLIETPQPTEELYNEIAKGYQQEGVSPVIEGIRTRAAKQRNKQAIDATFGAFGEGKLNQGQLEAVLASTPAMTEDDIVDLNREVILTNTARQTAQSPEEQAVLDAKMRRLVTEGYSTQQAIMDRMDWMKSKMGDSAGNITKGIAVDLLPFVTTVSFKNAFNKVFPDTELGYLDMPRGEIMMKFREEFSKLSDEDKYTAAVDLMNALTSDEGALTGQDFQNLMLLEESLNPEGFEEGFGGINWDRVIGNAISVLDTVSLGGVAKGLFAGTKTIFKPGTALSSMNIADPKSAAALANAGIKKDMSNALGMTPVEIAEVMGTPKPFYTHVELLPADLARQVEGGNNLKNGVIERSQGNPLILSEAEQRTVRNNFRDEVKEVGTAGAYGGNYTARATDTGIEFTATYGVKDAAGETIPFKTAKDAAEHAAHTFPDARNIRIDERLPTGEIVPVKFGKTGLAGSRRSGEFVYTVDGFKTYANTEAGAQKLFFKDGDIIKSGPLAKWFYDPASRFAKWISEPFSQAGDKARGIAADVGAIALPFAKLKGPKQRKVVELLQKYAQDPVNMDYAKLARWADNDAEVINGFVAYRQTMDAVYELENMNLRNDLLQQGVKGLNIDGYKNMGSAQSRHALSEQAHKGGNQLEIYDPVKDAMVTLTGRQIDEVLERGQSIYKVKEAAGHPGRQSDLVLVTEAKYVSELPVYVLNKIDGYIPRFYKETYFIQKKVPGYKNGIKGTNVQMLRAVGDLSEANQAVRQLVAEGKLTAAEAKDAIIHDRSLGPAQRASFDMDDKISLGRMFYHERAKERLKGVDGLARISNPIEAMMRNIESTSKHVSEFELLTTMKNRWINTFGKEAGLTERGSFPANKADIGSQYNLVGKDKQQAIAMWEHIRKSEGMMTGGQEAWRDTFLSMAEGIIGNSTRSNLLGKVRAGAGQAATWLGENSLNRMIRTVAFWHLIALNPIRQLYVQSQQFHFLLATAGAEGPKMFAQGTAMAVAWQSRKVSPAIYNAGKPVWAKSMGMSTKQFDDFMEKWSQTGLPHSLDSHDYVRNTLREYSMNAEGNFMTRGAKKLWAAGTLAPVRSRLKEAGFNTGELTNLSSTFLLAQKKYLKATGKKSLKSRKDWETVAASARNMALDMTHSGAFAYQDGLLSGLTQFMSIQHKAALALMPFKKTGNQSFTQAERWKIAAGQAVFTGATGLGLYEVYKDAKEYFNLQIPASMEPYIVGGMYEVALNALFNTTTTDERLNFAETIAPLGGLNADSLGEVFLGNKSLVDSFAAMNVINRYKDMAETFATLQAVESMSDEDNIMNHIENFASTTSGYSQVLRAKAALRLGYHVSNSGNASVQSTFATAIAEGTLGIKPRSMEEFYSLQKDYAGRINMKSEFGIPDVFGDTDEVARSLYDELNRVAIFFNEDYDPDIEQLANASELHKMHIQKMRDVFASKKQILDLYDPIERDRIWQRISDIAAKEKQAGAPTLITNIMKSMLKGDVTGQSAQGIISRLRVSGLYNPESPEGRQIEDNLNRIWESLMATQRYSDENMKQFEDQVDG